MRAQPVAKQKQAAPGLLIYRFTHGTYYANTQFFTEEVLYLVTEADVPIQWLCIDASSIDDVDYSAAETLRSLHALLQEKGVRLVIAEVLDDVKQQSRYNLISAFGEDSFFETLDEVIAAYQKHLI